MTWQNYKTGFTYSVSNWEEEGNGMYLEDISREEKTHRRLAILGLHLLEANTFSVLRLKKIL